MTFKNKIRFLTCINGPGFYLALFYAEEGEFFVVAVPGNALHRIHYRFGQQGVEKNSRGKTVGY